MLDMKFAIITFVLLFTTLVNSQEPLAGGVPVCYVVLIKLIEPLKGTFF